MPDHAETDDLSRGDTARDFEDQLERYDQQYRESVDRRRRVGKGVSAAGFATAAGSALAMASGAEAAVIFSGPQNIYVAIHPTSINSNYMPIDIDGDGVEDLQFGIYASFSSGGSTSPSYSSQRMFVVGSTFSGVQQASVALDNSYSSPRKFSAMSSVGSAENWAGSTNSEAVFNQGQNILISSNVPSGTWSGSENGTIGFRLKKGGDVHYGWLRVELVDPTTPQGSSQGSSYFADGLSDQVKIVDWAYESTPNTPIPVPEPSGLAMLAAGAAGLGAWRKRREQAKKSVENPAA